MKAPRLMPLVAAAALLGACVDQPTAPSPDSQTQFNAVDAGSTYLIRFSKNSIPNGFAANVAGLGGEVVFAHAGAGVAAVAGLTPFAAAQLRASNGVAAVDEDALIELEEPVMEVDGGQLSDVDSPTAPTTAFFYGRQVWNMAAVRADQAWAAGKFGSSAIKVGILDTGLDYLHPDLFGRVDLALSRSFLSAAENARVPAGAHLVADLHYHGTHVGATVASNAWIAAGVTSQVTLVGLKVCAPGTPANGFRASCPTSGTLSAILYAADNAIPIINMSLGGAFSRQAASANGGNGPSFLATINSVMNYANKRGTIVFVSAGNTATNMDNDSNSYNSYCDAVQVMCLSATGPTAAGFAATPAFPRGTYVNVQNVDALASYSNYGLNITIAAPGGNAIPVWAACSGFTLVPALASCRSRFYNSPTSWSGSIVGLSGTSMASPHAAGVGALVASHSLTGASQIRARLKETADDLGAAGIDPQYGHGRINAARALGLL